MFRMQQHILIVLLTIMGVFLCRDTLRAQSEVEDSLADLQSVTDSVVAVLAKAVLTRDSAMLSTVFHENVNIRMPDKVTHRGKKEVMKYVPLFLEKVGGWKFTTSRITLDLVRNMGGIAREKGRYELAEPTEQGTGKIWKGEYLAYWRLHDKKWVLNKLLLSKD